VTTTAPRLLQVRRSTRVTPRMVRVTLAGDELTGIATGVDPAGRLLVDTGAATVVVGAGDVVHLRTGS